MYIRILSVWDFNLFCNYQQITQCASRQTIAMLLRQTIATLLRKHSQPARRAQAPLADQNSGGAIAEPATSSRP